MEVNGTFHKYMDTYPIRHLQTWAEEATQRASLTVSGNLPAKDAVVKSWACRLRLVHRLF